MHNEKDINRSGGNENIETELLLRAIYLKYGYDFSNYSRSSIKRRVRKRLLASGMNSISEMQHRLLNDRLFFEELLNDLSINVTEMFRNPPFYLVLRNRVIPALAARDHLKIWHCGCSTGEEVYSAAILFQEEGVYEKTRFYATDFNEKVIAKAKKGIYPLNIMKSYTNNYQKSGGTGSFGDYYTAMYNNAIIDSSLKNNVLFSDHNLVTDSSFGEMDMIVCRNVLIYFSGELQDRVIRLFNESLVPGGFLCLGSKESIRFSTISSEFEDFNAGHRIYRKKYPDDPRHQECNTFG